MAKRSPSPSPWTTYTPGIPCGNKDRWIVDGKGRTIAVVWYDKNTPANARLIAAAPDLLAVVCEMLGAAETDLLDDKSNVWRSAMISARAAINKAKGN